MCLDIPENAADIVDQQVTDGIDRVFFLLKISIETILKLRLFGKRYFSLHVRWFCIADIYHCYTPRIMFNNRAVAVFYINRTYAARS